MIFREKGAEVTKPDKNDKNEVRFTSSEFECRIESGVQVFGSQNAGDAPASIGRREPPTGRRRFPTPLPLFPSCLMRLPCRLMALCL